MKIIVPMAGRGSRLRPHSLTVPKPLIPVAGKPIVHRLVMDIAKVLHEPVDEIAFILGAPEFFGKKVVSDLENLAHSLNAKCSIYRQNQPLGTGHAIMCAKESLKGPAVIAYADTLIRVHFKLDQNTDNLIWTKAVDNPQAYGVVKLNPENEIIELVEKPSQFVSNQAVIGIYYFKNIEILKNELQKILDQQLTHGGEYQINDGIKSMMKLGHVFKSGMVNDWMDCGNKSITVNTNHKMLEYLHKEGDEKLIDDSVVLENSRIIEPCFVGKNVKLSHTTLGPYVSVGNNCVIENATVSESLIQNNTTIKNATLNEAMIGNEVVFNGEFSKISIGDYSVLE